MGLPPPGLSRLIDAGSLAELPLRDSIAAISVGMVDGAPLLDLAYSEDSRAESDMNVVMTGVGRLVELLAALEDDPEIVVRLWI